MLLAEVSMAEIRNGIDMVTANILSSVVQMIDDVSLWKMWLALVVLQVLIRV